tara:strand:+ start:80 stop:463 length:384 start_codon:yes stop_codon:yes gene_type:complete
MTTYIRDIHLNPSMTSEKVTNASLMKAIEAQSVSLTSIADGITTMVRFMGANQTATMPAAVNAPVVNAAPQAPLSLEEQLREAGVKGAIKTDVIVKGCQIEGDDWKKLKDNYAFKTASVITGLSKRE